MTEKQLRERDAKSAAGTLYHDAVGNGVVDPYPSQKEPLWTDEEFQRAKEAIRDRASADPDKTKTGDEFGGQAATNPGEPASIAGSDAEDAKKMAEWDAANP